MVWGSYTSISHERVQEPWAVTTGQRRGSGTPRVGPGHSAALQAPTGDCAELSPLKGRRITGRLVRSVQNTGVTSRDRWGKNGA